MNLELKKMAQKVKNLTEREIELIIYENKPKKASIKENNGIMMFCIETNTFIPIEKGASDILKDGYRIIYFSLNEETDEIDSIISILNRKEERNMEKRIEEYRQIAEEGSWYHAHKSYIIPMSLNVKTKEEAIKLTQDYKEIRKDYLDELRYSLSVKTFTNISYLSFKFNLDSIYVR